MHGGWTPAEPNEFWRSCFVRAESFLQTGQTVTGVGLRDLFAEKMK
jgi:hypothetical protein